MKRVYGSEIRTNFAVTCRINGKSFRFVGTGLGNATTGNVSVDIATEDILPKGFNPGLLAFAMITGQPDISRTAPNVNNPFQEVGGEYHGVRTLDLGAKGMLTADYVVSAIEGGVRTATFVITGETNAPEVHGIEPAFEVWVPNGPGLIHGHFTMVWVTAAGSLKGEIDSQYRLPTTKTLESVSYRKIDFNLAVESKRLIQNERIQLFTAREMAEPVAA